MNRRVGILGGTFDPIHHGHLVAAQEARHQLDLDRVLIVPAGRPPHKPQQPITPAHHRLRMVELAIAPSAHLSISSVDLDRPGPSYTVDMLDLLRTEWGPDALAFFILGADLLADILTWHQPQRLIQLCRLAVVDRSDVDLDLGHLEEQLPGLTASIDWVRMPALDISSRDLRARVKEGRPISYLVPREVEAYIADKGLYQDTEGG
jgi:nicotinate-nucleotide adenylyltransferase